MDVVGGLLRSSLLTELGDDHERVDRVRAAAAATPDGRAVQNRPVAPSSGAISAAPHAFRSLAAVGPRTLQTAGVAADGVVETGWAIGPTPSLEGNGDRCKDIRATGLMACP